MKIIDYINALPDSYQKHSESNNYKLLLLEEQSVSNFRKDMDAIQDTLDISKATGNTLDLYGEIYNKPRGIATDEQYRYLILQKVAQNMVDGTFNSVIKAIAVALGIDVTGFHFAETENDCEVEVLDMPYSAIQSMGMTVKQMQTTIQALLPVGVRLAPLNLSGTFEFASTSEEYDEEAGFGNVDQTIGGYFGYLAN